MVIKAISYITVITGGAQGIGLAIAQRCRARGDVVYAFDCLPDDDHRVVDLAKSGINYLRVDVRDKRAVQQAFAAIDAAHPQGPTLLVNNAGVTRDGLVMRMDEIAWDEVIDVNLKGAFLCTQQAVVRMIKQKKGYIINMSSVVGIYGNAGQVNYAASKAGIIGLTKSVAKEYVARNVLVNAIAPGFIATAMTEKLSDDQKQQILARIGLGRLGTPNDIAQLVDFLSSGYADYITGQVIEVAGGMW